MVFISSDICVYIQPRSRQFRQQPGDFDSSLVYVSEKVTDGTSALEALCAVAAVGSPAPKPSAFSVVANGLGQDDLGILVPIAGKAREQNATRVKALAPTSWHENSPAVMMELTTKEWIHPAGTEWIPWIEMPRSFAKNRLQSMPIKGRNSREEKDAEKTADEILRSKSWIVSNETPFHIVEQLVLMLCVSLRPLISLHALPAPTPLHVGVTLRNG